MRRGYRRVSGVMAVMAILAVSACGEATSDRGTPDTTRYVPDTTRYVPDTTRAAVDRDEVVGPSEPEDVFRAPVSYLEEVIPPCVPLEGGSHDPCARTRPQQVAVLSVSGSPPAWPYDDNLRTITQTIMGYDPPSITHIVVRATVLDDTTRCGLHPLVLADYTRITAFPSEYRYNCYVDVRVNEYIVGTGPSELTVDLHGEVLNLTEEQRADWYNWKGGWLTDVVHIRKREPLLFSRVTRLCCSWDPTSRSPWNHGTAAADSPMCGSFSSRTRELPGLSQPK